VADAGGCLAHAAPAPMAGGFAIVAQSVLQSASDTKVPENTNRILLSGRPLRPCREPMSGDAARHSAPNDAISRCRRVKRSRCRRTSGDAAPKLGIGTANSKRGPILYRCRCRSVKVDDGGWSRIVINDG
jgi:hypothetical protein